MTYGYSDINLFEQYEGRFYFESQKDKIRSEINSISNDEIVSCDLDEWKSYLVDKHSIELIEFFEEAADLEAEEGKMKSYNTFRNFPGEPDFFMVDAIIFRKSIPYFGNGELLKLQPSRYTFSKYTVDDLRYPNGENAGKITLRVEFRSSELNNCSNDEVNEKVTKRFDSVFDSIQTMVTYINADANAFNSSLESEIGRWLEEKKSKASSFYRIQEAMKINLVRSEAAPNTTPIKLKKVVRKVPTKPKAKPVELEYTIDESDYQNINNIIMMCGTSMENSARTYYNHQEEELRDLLLSTLDTHYENATGETFRKLGKTDISIPFENKAAYIAECKIWHGDKKFQEAIQQVLNYSTWRDRKLSVIIFNKDNKNFENIITKVHETLINKATNVNRKKHNRWECLFYDSEAGTNVELSVMLFNLYVDKTQFNDRRFD